MSGADVDLQRFFEVSLDCLAVAGFDGYFKWVNPAWTTTLGWTREELLAKPTIEFVHPDDRARTLAARAQLQQGQPLSTLTNRYLCKGGGLRWLEWRSISSPDQQLVYAAARDVTKQREGEDARHRMQAQLLIAERMASVGRLAAGVAHEINNPLSFVIANQQLVLRALRQLPPDQMPEQAELVAVLAEGTDRIRRIVVGLQSFSKAGEGHRALVKVESVADRTIELVSEELQRCCRVVRRFGDTPPVEVDEARLNEVLVNLLLNAIEAMTPGTAERSEVRVITSTDARGWVVIAIEDTGQGVPAESLSRIFDPFFTTKPPGQGAGLGLTICHNIVREMGGELTVSSPPQGGAVFRVALPATG